MTSSISPAVDPVVTEQLVDGDAAGDRGLAVARFAGVLEDLAQQPQRG